MSHPIPTPMRDEPLNGVPADFAFGASAPEAPDPVDVGRLRLHADADAIEVEAERMRGRHWNDRGWSRSHTGTDARHS